jgi:S1-C subfamily serine protease
MNGIVIRLAGVPNPETKVFHQTTITIGTSADCDVWVVPETPAIVAAVAEVSSDTLSAQVLPADSMLLTLKLSDGVYRIASLTNEANVQRDGEPVVIGEALHDGDTFHFGATGIRLRIFGLSDEVQLADSLKLGTAMLARVKPAARQLRLRRRQKSELQKPEALSTTDLSVAVPRTDVAIVFVKQLARELAAEIPKRWLYAMLGLGVFLIGLGIYIPTISFIQGRSNQQAINELNKTIEDTKRQLVDVTKELNKVSENAQSAVRTVSFASRVVEDYGQGVCLIYGSYSFFDPRAGRDVRFRELSENNNPINPNGGLNLSANGTGRVYETEFIGTGFLVEKGLVLSNRHVLHPWEDDPVASLIRAQGLRPRVRELLVYFPKAHQPFVLKQLELSTDRDVALCGFEQGETNLPILPLDEKAEGAISGQSVVLMGFPAGLDGLLARVDERERWGLSRVNLRAALNELAAREQIRPQSTQGHIGDITERQLVYDAATSEGGSGGPVFGLNGKVIGINQAMMPNSPSNFGVPIRYGLELLQKYKATLQAKLNELQAVEPSPSVQPSQ